MHNTTAKKYWEVDSSNYLSNNFKEITFPFFTGEVISFLLEDIFDYIPNIHSIYLDGRDLYKTVEPGEKLSLDFVILFGSSDISDFYDVDRDEYLQKKLHSFKTLLVEKVRKNLNFELEVTLETDSISFFKSNLLGSRFMNRCIWGEDLSIDKLDFRLIDEKLLDGLEKEDQEVLKENRDEILKLLEYINEDQLSFFEYKIKHYLKLLLRCAFNCICRDIKIWTKDPYYCYYFFSKKYNDLEELSKKIFDLYSHYNMNVLEIYKIVEDSKIIIDKIVMLTE